MATVAIVVLTHNRVHLLRECVERVLGRASQAVTEILIWDNGSTDGTGAYLDGLDDPRLTVVHHRSNIGQNAYARAFRRTSADYLVELDDDVVEAPFEWDAMLVSALERLPDVGFLAADLEDDPYDLAAHYRHRIRPHEYADSVENGVRLLLGPAGGGCAMTPRAVYDRVGGFRERRGQVFWQEETAYIDDLRRAGYRAAVLADLRVLHHGGEHYAGVPPAKAAYWATWERRLRRRAAVKRALFRIPLFRRANDRFRWVRDPDAVKAPARNG